MNDLTDKQQELLLYLLMETVDNLYQPSIREMATALQVTPSAIHQRLKAIEAMEYIDLCRGKNRAIGIKEKARVMIRYAMDGEIIYVSDICAQ
jgi:SOS-response transcriptional repressor LexA